MNQLIAEVLIMVLAVCIGVMCGLLVGTRFLLAFYLHRGVLPKFMEDYVVLKNKEGGGDYRVAPGSVPGEELIAKKNLKKGKAKHG